MNAAAVLTEILSAHKFYVARPGDAVCLGCPVPQHGTMRQFVTHDEFVEHLVELVAADPRIEVVSKADAAESCTHRVRAGREGIGGWVCVECFDVVGGQP